MDHVIICDARDLDAWIVNCNPANILSEEGRETKVSALVEAIRTEPTRPIWGADWGPWLAEHAERLAVEVATA